MASLLDDTATSPTAVFTANNLMTIGAMRLLRERGVSIPAQMSLVGFDDLDLSELLDPPPTVIDRATFALGSSAAEMLRARLAAPDRAQQHLILPVELIVRGSTTRHHPDDLPAGRHPVRRRADDRPAAPCGPFRTPSTAAGAIVTNAPSQVVVVGSITADVTAYSRPLPVPGETVLGDTFTLVLGGKGANQALAAARAGATSTIIGCVGDDLFRDLVLSGLHDGGVGTAGITTVPGPTGVAHIRVDSASGQNDIVIVPLANAALTPDLAEAAAAGGGPSG